MNITNLLKNSNSDWVRYSDYEYKLDKWGEVYISPTKDSEPEFYDPATVGTELVADALNIGRLVSQINPNGIKIKELTLDFCRKYGLIGFMASFPLSLNFVDKKEVLLGDNPLTKKETMKTKEYLKLFTPFEDINIICDFLALEDAISFSVLSGKPKLYDLLFSTRYAEKVDWILSHFKDLYSHFEACTAVKKEDGNSITPVYENIINGFKTRNIGFQTKLTDTITLVWDFISLKNLTDAIYASMITDDTVPLRVCKHCEEVFISTHSKAEFCSPQCRNQFNVYKSRGK